MSLCHKLIPHIGRSGWARLTIKDNDGNMTVSYSSGPDDAIFAEETIEYTSDKGIISDAISRVVLTAMNKAKKHHANEPL